MFDLLAHVVQYTVMLEPISQKNNELNLMNAILNNFKCFIRDYLSRWHSLLTLTVHSCRLDIIKSSPGPCQNFDITQAVVKLYFLNMPNSNTKDVQSHVVQAHALSRVGKRRSLRMCFVSWIIKLGHIKPFLSLYPQPSQVISAFIPALVKI